MGNGELFPIPHSLLPMCLLRSLFYMYGAVGADGAHISPASADHANDRPAAQLRAGFEFPREFGVDRPVVALDRQVEIAFGRQCQNDVAVGAEELVAPAFVKPAREKHAAVGGSRRHVFAINVVQRDRAVGGVRFNAAFGVADLYGAADGGGASALDGAADDDIAVERIRHDEPARVRDRDRIGVAFAITPPPTSLIL